MFMFIYKVNFFLASSCPPLSQITDKFLMSQIKQKWDLVLPYAGAVLKKNDKYNILFTLHV